jgi:hypothetical protein
MDESDWKLKLKYGKLDTPFTHYTLLADGIVHDLEEGFECRKGKAYLGMKVWAISHDEAAEVIQSIGDQIGFEVTGEIQIFDSDPLEPPGENPFCYGITFTPYD